jgi:hypothetical protein
MLWDGTKFLTEKLVGAIVGQALKLLFVTLTFMLAINGFLALMVRPFDSFIDQMIYTLFTIFSLVLVRMPALATSLLTVRLNYQCRRTKTAASMSAAMAEELPRRVPLHLRQTGTRARLPSTRRKGIGSQERYSGSRKEKGTNSWQDEGSGPIMGDSPKETVKSGAHGLEKAVRTGKAAEAEEALVHED